MRRLAALLAALLIGSVLLAPARTLSNVGSVAPDGTAPTNTDAPVPSQGESSRPAAGPPPAPQASQVETVPEPLEQPTTESEPELPRSSPDEREEPEGQLLPPSDPTRLRPAGATGPEPLPRTGYEAIPLGVLGAALTLLGTVLWRLSGPELSARASRPRQPVAACERRK